MKTILAAIDLSPVSNLVVAEAAAMARALGGKVILMTVLVEPVYVKEYAPPPRHIAKITRNHERAVRHRLATIEQQLQSDFIPAATVVRRGSPASEILKEAEEQDATCIVLGSHGHTALHDLILGSTSQMVLKRASRPVLVIPPKMKKRRKAKIRVEAYQVET